MAGARNICPTCNGYIPDADTRVDLANNVLTRHGLHVQLQRTGAEIMSVLVGEFPKPVSRDRMIMAVWGINEVAKPDTSLSTHMSRLRPTIEPLGMFIHTVWGFGWRLEQRPRDHVADDEHKMRA